MLALVFHSLARSSFNSRTTIGKCREEFFILSYAMRNMCMFSENAKNRIEIKVGGGNMRT